MTKKLVWRLANRPTPREVQDLMEVGIITKDEAREILFSQDGDESKKEELEAEIKFLRQLVEKLSEDKTQIVETIKYIKEPYYHDRWYKPYDIYCSTNVGAGTTTTYSFSAIGSATDK